MAPKQPGTEAVRNFAPSALRDIRRRCRLTHDALAAIVGVSRPNLIAYEKGRCRPSPERLVQLATALKVDPLDLTRATLATATLADLRTRAGLSTSATAARLGIDRPTYQAMEIGGRPLTPALKRTWPSCSTSPSAG